MAMRPGISQIQSTKIWCDAAPRFSDRALDHTPLKITMDLLDAENKKFLYNFYLFWVFIGAM